jgi:hypothetical protein
MSLIIIRAMLQISKANLDSELCSKCALYVLTNHQLRILSTASTEISELLRLLHESLRKSVGESRSVVGSNLAALKFINNKLNEERTSHFVHDDPVNAVRQSKRKRLVN